MWAVLEWQYHLGVWVSWSQDRLLLAYIGSTMVVVVVEYYISS
jgi:hypothetical protein